MLKSYVSMSHSMSDKREGALWRISAPTSRTHVIGTSRYLRYRVTAEVDHGLVTMQGVVERAYQRSCAEAIVRRVPGVIGVRNEIAVGAAQDLSQPTVPA